MIINNNNNRKVQAQVWSEVRGALNNTNNIQIPCQSFLIPNNIRQWITHISVCEIFLTIHLIVYVLPMIIPIRQQFIRGVSVFSLTKLLQYVLWCAFTYPRNHSMVTMKSAIKLFLNKTRRILRTHQLNCTHSCKLNTLHCNYNGTLISFLKICNLNGQGANHTHTHTQYHIIYSLMMASSSWPEQKRWIVCRLK